MDEEAVLEIAKGMISERLNIDPDRVTMDASLTDDLELDSLDLVELVMSIEERFGIQIEDQDAGELQTVGDAVRLVTQMAQSPAS